MKKVYSICEYEYFTRAKEIEDSRFLALPEKVFDLFLNYIMAYSLEETNLQDLFVITQKKKLGIVIQATNYVGTILLKNGVSIEVLPKIAENHVLYEKERNVLFHMLVEVWNLPLKKAGEASLLTDKKGIFEWFIAIFLNEMEQLIQHGLCLDYRLEESNEKFLKGRLLFSKHITTNAVHREQFYVERDVFSGNRPENRLIKTTLLKINRAVPMEAQIKIKQLLSYFCHIPPSTQIEEDIKRCKKDRNSKNYNKVMEWCKVFLNQKGFSTFYGNEQFLSLFFPMERLFEQYVANRIYRSFHSKQCAVKRQARGAYLFDSAIRQHNFELIPDILIDKEGAVFILDTKWKCLKENKKNYGISQQDIYQMFVYGVHFNAKKVIMLYPKSAEISEKIEFCSRENMIIKVIWVDLFHMDETLEEIKLELKESKEK